jgi:putative addiction module component (TIGR02574 family)
MLAKELKELSRSEKLLLINELWEDISESADDLEISNELNRKLDERYEAFQKEPEQGMAWTEFKAQFRD